jgi:hypothetical protein
MIAATAVLATLGGLTSCADDYKKPRPDRIKNLCVYVDTHSNKELLTGQGFDDVSRLSGMGGIPAGLGSAARGYYEGEKIDGGANYPAARRDRLDVKRKKIIDACHATGWKE